MPTGGHENTHTTALWCLAPPQYLGSMQCLHGGTVQPASDWWQSFSATGFWEVRLHVEVKRQRSLSTCNKNNRKKKQCLRHSGNKFIFQTPNKNFK